MQKHTPEFTRAVSSLTCTDVFFTALLYNTKIEARDDLPAAAATDGVHIYYHPERYAKEFSRAEQVFVIVHELLHGILFHPMRRGIRDAQGWNIACDYVVNLLCQEYGFSVPKSALLDSKYKGMTAEQVYDQLPKEAKQPQGGLADDVLDYDPAQNEGKSKGDVEREIAIGVERATQAAKAAGADTARMKRIIGNAQVQHEPWYQHLRRYMTSMHTRQYNWARIDTRRAVLHGVVSPQQKAENMGKVVFWVDCSGSVTEKQLSAMSAHISDILKDVCPSSVVVGYFDSKVCHVDEFTGPDYPLTLEPHGGGGTCFAPMFDYMQEYHADAQLAIVFTDLYGSFGEGNLVCDTLWVSQTEGIDVPFGELIYGDLNEG